MSNNELGDPMMDLVKLTREGFQHVNGRLGNMEAQLTGLVEVEHRTDENFEKMDRRFNSLNGKLNELLKRTESRPRTGSIETTDVFDRNQME